MNEVNIDLDTTIKPLKVTRRTLRNIDDEELDKMEPASQNEWATSLHTVSVAIIRLETARFNFGIDSITVSKNQNIESLHVLIWIIGV